MNIEKQKLGEELKNIKNGIYDKYYSNIFKYLSEHTFEREDAKRILQIENYKVTDNFVEIEQNNVKFVIDYKNKERKRRKSICKYEKRKTVYKKR